MAVSIATRQYQGRRLRDELLRMVHAARQHIAARALYNKTVRELSDMSGRELADLGLHRSEIRRVAHDSVYGARR